MVKPTLTDHGSSSSRPAAYKIGLGQFHAAPPERRGRVAKTPLERLFLVDTMAQHFIILLDFKCVGGYCVRWHKQEAIMSYDSWICLLNEDGPGIVPESVRDTLKITACDLHRKRWNRMPVIGDTCEGTLETRWDTHSVGSQSGVLFRAQITTDNGTWRVNFLLNVRDLERGAEMIREYEEGETPPWVRISGVDCPALRDFRDLTRVRQKRR